MSKLYDGKEGYKMEKLSHEEMMNRAWQFIGVVGITDDADTKDEAIICKHL